MTWSAVLVIVESIHVLFELIICLQVIGEVELGGSVQAMDCFGYGKQFALGGMPQIVKVCKMIWLALRFLFVSKVEK